MGKKEEITGYELSRIWFDWCFENPELITPSHTAMYFFIIEHWNRMGQKDKFGLPSEMTKDAIGIKNYKTFSKVFHNLVDWGFIKLIQKSKNQYSSNIIALVKNTKANTKALTKASLKHVPKQVQSIVGIFKPNNLIILEPESEEKEIITHEKKNEKRYLVNDSEFDDFLNHNQVWKEQICMVTHTTMKDVETAIKEFADKLKTENVKEKPVADIYSHFANWYRIKIKNEKNEKDNKTGGGRNPGFAKNGYDPNNGIGNGELLSAKKRPQVFQKDSL